MAADELSGEEGDSLDPGDGAAEDLRLLRRYEPVLRFTQGELFLPMSVPVYLATCALERSPGPARLPWRRAKGERLCAPGELSPARLAQIGAAPHAGGLSLRYADRSLTWRAYRAWRREPGRERLAHRSSRFAVVGLVGRLIDAVIRLSLLVRGRVPGGTAAAAEQAYRAGPAPAPIPTTVGSPGTAVSSRCSTGSCMR